MGALIRGFTWFADLPDRYPRAFQIVAVVYMAYGTWFTIRRDSAMQELVGVVGVAAYAHLSGLKLGTRRGRRLERERLLNWPLRRPVGPSRRTTVVHRAPRVPMLRRMNKAAVEYKPLVEVVGSLVPIGSVVVGIVIVIVSWLT